jgi:hypothetical protein
LVSLRYLVNIPRQNVCASQHSNACSKHIKTGITQFNKNHFVKIPIDNFIILDGLHCQKIVFKDNFVKTPKDDQKYI